MNFVEGFDKFINKIDSILKEFKDLKLENSKILAEKNIYINNKLLKGEINISKKLMIWNKKTLEM